MEDLIFATKPKKKQIAQEKLGKPPPPPPKKKKTKKQGGLICIGVIDYLIICI